MADYDRLRAQASGNNQPNLNAAMIADYLVPVPPRAEQQRLLAAVNTARVGTQAKRTAAESLRASAKDQLEAALLGQVNNGESLNELLLTGLASTPANPADENYSASLRAQVVEATGQTFNKPQQGDNP